MNAADLLADLSCRGFTLAAEEHGIRIRPASHLSPEVRHVIVANRAELLKLLKGGLHPGSKTLSCLRCGRLLDSKRRCWRCCDRICRCGGLSGSAFIELCVACGHEFNGNRGDSI
jgi:hypothetical protein